MALLPLNRGFSVNINSQTWVASDNQAMFTLSNGRYAVGKNVLEVYVDGIHQDSDYSYTELSPTSFLLTEGLPAGTIVEAKWYENTLPSISTGHSASHKLGGQDELNIRDLAGFDSIHYHTNVKEFGAKGDGLADDTVSIQNAVNSIAGNQGGHLFFPPGTYKITGEIVIPFITGFLIEGASRGSVIIKQHTDNKPIFKFTSNDTHSFEIENITFDYLNPQVSVNTASNIIYFTAGSYNFSISDCTFNNAYYGINQSVQPAIVWGVEIKNCIFNGSLSGGAVRIKPSPAVGQPNINIENCYIRCDNHTAAAIDIGTSDSVLLESVEFNGGSYVAGVRSQLNIGTCYNVTLLNCRSEAAGLTGSTGSLWGFSNSVINVIGCAVFLNVTDSTGSVYALRANVGSKLSVKGFNVGGTIAPGASTPIAVYADDIVSLENLVVGSGFNRIAAGSKQARIDMDIIQPNVTQIRGDVDVTLTSTDYPIQYFNTTFTANRNLTLPSTGLYDGMTFTIIKEATDNFTLKITDPKSGKTTIFPAGVRGSVTYRATGPNEWIPTENLSVRSVQNPRVSVSDKQVTSTSQQTIATLTPAIAGNFEALIYCRVTNASTTVSLSVTFADGSGAQTQTIVNNQLQPVGSYCMVPLFINAVTGTDINVKATAGTANNLYVSCVIRPII